jgi:hypothetical protein
MWLVAQNAVRYLVLPSELLNRVNAVIQTAIYGVRPLGVLAGGPVAGVYCPVAGLWRVIIVFGLSLAVSVFSDLRRATSYDALRASSVGASVATAA